MWARLFTLALLFSSVLAIVVDKRAAPGMSFGFCSFRQSDRFSPKSTSLSDSLLLTEAQPAVPAGQPPRTCNRIPRLESCHRIVCIRVTSLAALRSAVAGTNPKIVQVSGIITGGDDYLCFC